MARKTIAQAPAGEKTSLDGTEKFPISGSQYSLLSTVLAYIRTAVATLTNKTINLANNTVTGTTAEFNTALSDGNFATIAGSEVLTNKTLTAPTIADFTNMAHDHQDADDGGTLAEAALALTDITTNNASAAKHGFLPKLSGDSTLFLNGDGEWTAPTISGAVSDSDILFTDITTNNSTTTQHGFLPKLSGDSDQFLNGDGEWITPTVAGSVATDAIWDAAGDLAVGTGANTAARLAVGTTGHVLTADSAEASGVKWAEATGGTNTGWVLIASSVLGSDNTFTFSSIPGTYASLRLRMRLRSDVSAVTDGFRLQVGNSSLDTGSNYAYMVRREGFAQSNAQSTGAAFVEGVIITGNTATANYFSISEVTIDDYATATYWRNMLITGGHTDGAGYRIATGVGTWKNAAAAIDILKVYPGSGTNFITGSAVWLYGMKNS